MAETETLEEVRRVSWQRLYPSLTNPNWLVLRKRRELFRGWLAGMRLSNPAVLDVGGRLQPYRSLIDGGRARYTAIDLTITPLVNVAGDAQQLPFANDIFDLVICTQMLEYAPEPPRVMAEIRRVLKTGGYLLMSVPSVSPRDADHDRWRFLAPGIRQLVSGFSSAEIVPEGGSIAGFFRTINSYLQIFARYDLVRTVLSYSVVPVLNVMGALLERMAGSTNDQFAVNYSVLARK